MKIFLNINKVSLLMSKTGLFRSKLQQKFILNQLARSSFALIAIIKIGGSKGRKASPL